MDVKQMFNEIAPTYDALNHLLSMGIDKGWRARVVKMVEGVDILDVATGTGDLAIAIARRLSETRVVGVDISEGMLAIAKVKSEQLKVKNGAARKIGFRVASAEALEFPDGSFDCVTAAFGVRNFGDKERGLSEMCRVSRQGGVCLILEFSEPRSPIFGRVYRWYFHNILPLVGRVISRNKGAYAYLPRSVGDFPAPEKFVEMMLDAGFSSVTKRSLTGGVAYIYKGVK